MPFFGQKYQKTYSKKNPKLVKYDESLFRIATADSVLENEIGGHISVSSSLDTSSAWKDEFDKLIPKKSNIKNLGHTNNVRATYNRNSSFEDSDNGTNKASDNVRNKKKSNHYLRWNKNNKIVENYNSQLLVMMPKTNMSTPIGKSKPINNSMSCTISPINDKSDKNCDINVVSHEKTPIPIKKFQSSDLHLSFIGTPTFSQYNEIGTNKDSSYVSDEDKNQILTKKNVEVSRDLFSGCTTGSPEMSPTNNVSNSKPALEASVKCNSIANISLEKSLEEASIKGNSIANISLEKSFKEASIKGNSIANISLEKSLKEASIKGNSIANISLANIIETEDYNLINEKSTSKNSIKEFIEKKPNPKEPEDITFKDQTDTSSSYFYFDSILNYSSELRKAVEERESQNTTEDNSLISAILSSTKINNKAKRIKLTSKANSQNQPINSNGNPENSTKPKAFVTKRNSSKTRLAQIHDKQESSLINISESKVTRIATRRTSKNSISSNSSDLGTSRNNSKTGLEKSIDNPKALVTKNIEELEIDENQESSLNFSEPKVPRITTRRTSKIQQKKSDLISRDCSNEEFVKPKTFVTKRGRSKMIEKSQIDEKQGSSMDSSEPKIQRITTRRVGSKNKQKNSDLVVNRNSSNDDVSSKPKSFVTKRNSTRRTRLKQIEESTDLQEESSINVSEPKIERITRRKGRTKKSIDEKTEIISESTDASNTESLLGTRRTLRSRSINLDAPASLIVKNYVTRRTLRSTARKKLEISSDETNESSTSINFNQPKKSNLKRKTTVAFETNLENEKSADENFEARKSKKKSVFFNSIPENEKVLSISDSLEISKKKPSIFLKPGKWRKSLALWRASHVTEVRESAIYTNNRRKSRVIQIVDLISEESHSSGTSTIQTTSSQNSLGFEESDDLCNLSALSLLDESKSFINPKTFVKHKSLICSNNEINEEESEQQKVLRRRRTTAVSKYIDYQPTLLAPKLDAEKIVLRRCQQSEPLDFNEVYSESVLRNCRKIGEGVYGEVFMNKTVTGEAVVLKIIPIEGQQQINGESQKKFDEILSEIVIAMELSSLKNDNDFMTSGFVDVVNVRCVKGKYPEHLIDLWELYRDNHETENDHPEVFQESQLYIVLELANGGQDLEAFTFSNALQSYSAFVQTAVTLAVAESKYQFEHRDLHWGNILLAQTEEKTIEFKLNGDVIKIPTHGVKVTIIDYTLSRMIYDGCCLYNDLSNDDELFSANGDYQFDIYRFMKTRLNNNWERHEPYTNVLWLHYVCDKMINGARYRSGKSKKHRSAIHDMMLIRDDLLDYKSSSEYVKNLK